MKDLVEFMNRKLDERETERKRVRNFLGSEAEDFDYVFEDIRGKRKIMELLGRCQRALEKAVESEDGERAALLTPIYMSLSLAAGHLSIAFADDPAYDAEHWSPQGLENLQI